MLSWFAFSADTYSVVLEQFSLNVRLKHGGLAKSDFNQSANKPTYY